MTKDHNGLIASITWAGDIDGGDSLAETGRIYFLKKLCSIEDDLMPFEKAVALLKDSGGNWRRTPGGPWSNPNDVSRDQLDPMVMALSLYGRSEDVSLEFNKFRERGPYYPNGDIASPEHLCHYIRHNNAPKGLKKTANYCLFLLGDLFMLLNTLIICFLRPARVENDLNHIVSLCYAEYFGGTFVSRFAARIYLKRRAYVGALMKYYPPETGNADLVFYYLRGLGWLSKRVL